MNSPATPNNVKELDKELAELKEFIADLKADRAAQKEKEKREAWTKYTSLSLVFIAVIAAVATQWAGKYSSRVLVNLNDATYNQALASDQWSYYQAKSIKQNLYEALGESVAHESGLSTNSAVMASFRSKIEKYKNDQADISKKAQGLEQIRDGARKRAAVASEHGSGMGSAIAIFQIAIALGSICLVTKRKVLWHISMVFSAVAIVKMLLVWLA